MLDIQIKDEFLISPAEQDEIRDLLATCFPEEPFTATRTYLKQAPPKRILVRSDGQLVGHAGVEHRVIGLEGSAARIFGILDVCVHPAARTRGIASRMLAEVEQVARSSGAEFVVLFASDARLYEKCGYHRRPNIVRWVKINEHAIIGIGCEPVPELMAKELTGRAWSSGVVDLLGHLF